LTSRIALGVIRKPHGIRGEVSVEPWTDSFERFEDLSNVILVSPDASTTREATIESAREHGGRALLKFAGFTTPEDVDALRQWTIEIPEEKARRRKANEFFMHDLIGLHLIDKDGHDRGETIDAYEGGGGVLLSVRRSDGKTYDVPFAETICTEIDLPGKKIIVELPEGIDED
jgi:16S rRNA processing protein RimM